MQEIDVTKKAISIRLDERLVKLLDDIKAKDGLYFDRNRTWLIEHALWEIYGEHNHQNSKKKEAAS